MNALGEDGELHSELPAPRQEMCLRRDAEVIHCLEKLLQIYQLDL